MTDKGYTLDSAIPPNVVVYGRCQLPAGDYGDIVVQRGAHLLAWFSGKARSLTVAHWDCKIGSEGRNAHIEAETVRMPLRPLHP